MHQLAHVQYVGALGNLIWDVRRSGISGLGWGYLQWFCWPMIGWNALAFIGHLVKQFLLIGGQTDIWQAISPYSGAFNTLFMISVAVVMIFYHKGVQAYEAHEQEAGKLKDVNSDLAAAASRLRDLNQNLVEKKEKRTEELSRSERKFRHLFSASKDMVFFYDADGHLVDMNDSGFEMLGYERADGGPLRLTGLFADTGMVTTYNDLLQRDGYIKDLDVEMVRQDGSVISVLLSATVLVGENGELQGSEAIAKDLTKVKIMLGQLASSEKMASVGQMADGVAHEINTPLGIILGYAQLLMGDFEEGHEQYESLQTIERQTKASRKIVADGLSVSYGIIHEHGGTIEVQSPVPGDRQTELPGTQFVIRLPVVDQRHGDAITQEPHCFE